MTQQKEKDLRQRGSTPIRTTAFYQDQTKTNNKDLDKDLNQDSDQELPHPRRRHRPLVQSASYQPGDSIRYRARWIQELDQDQEPDQIYSVVLIGDHDVGKSSLASVFAGISDRDQEENQENTFERTLTVDGEETTLIVMDTWDSHKLDYSAYVIVYSVTDRSSFDSASELRITVRQAQPHRTVPVIIVGNKTDLVRSREVQPQEGLACAVVFDCKFIETSASLNHNVSELWEGVVRQIRLHQDPANVLPLTPHHAHRRKESLTQRARRFLDRIVSRNNQRMALKVRSKSCHDLAVL